MTQSFDRHPRRRRSPTRPVSRLTGGLLAGFLVVWSAAAGAQEPPASGPGEAAPPSAEVSAAVQETIVGQIEAFQEDDGERALTYAIPQARRVWRTPEQFMDMVRRGYAAIYRPDEFSFEGAVARGDVVQQLVKVRGQSGRTYLALYEMYRQPDGRWLIGAVRTIEVKTEDDTI